MMPMCNYKKCKHVAEHNLGKLNWPGEYDGFGMVWSQTTWVCTKHRNKILKMLNIPIKPEKLS